MSGGQRRHGKRKIRWQRWEGSDGEKMEKALLIM
jgi:hypothetical protein